MSNPVTARRQGDFPIVEATEAASLVPADGTVLVSGFGSVGYPKAVPIALAGDDRPLSLTLVSGGSVGEEIDTKLVEARAIERRFPYQARPKAREAANNGDIEFHDRQVYQLGDEVQYGGLVDPDVAIIEAIAVGDDWLIPSTSIGHTPAFVESVDRLIVELNEAQPLFLQRMHDIYRPGVPPNRDPIPLTRAGERIGTPRIEFHPDALEAVVLTDRRDDPYSFRDPTDDDQAIAANLVDFFEREVERRSVFSDEVHLQFGVGSLGNALMSALSEMTVEGRDLVYFGEVLQDGLLDMLDADKLKTASATSLALSESGQNRLFDDVEAYAEDIVIRPTDVSNNPALINRFGVIAVNSALEIDIYGHVNSTHVNGRHIVNGIGGSGDFNRNALVTVVALPSTADDGAVSRIVPMVSHVDHTEHDVDVVVTDHGIADLRGRSPCERAELIIENCAHADYREPLHNYFDRARRQSGHICHDLGRAFSWNAD